VTLNAIAQGFAADRAADALRQHGISLALVDAGEIAAMGRKPDGQPWTVGIQDPRRQDAWLALARLADRCLATSGDYSTRFDDDYRAHHIFDPRTGSSPPDYASVSIAAASATEADALATAVFAMRPEKGLRLVRCTPSVDALLVYKDGRTVATERFPADLS
jgi:thiamine biosynthesis lipoprotein